MSNLTSIIVGLVIGLIIGWSLSKEFYSRFKIVAVKKEPLK